MQNSLCPVEGIFEGRLPDEPSLCARLEAPCIPSNYSSSEELVLATGEALDENKATIENGSMEINTTSDDNKADNVQKLKTRTSDILKSEKFGLVSTLEEDILEAAESVAGVLSLVSSNDIAADDDLSFLNERFQATTLRYTVYPCDGKEPYEGEIFF